MKETKRMGLIQSVDNENKIIYLIGYGEYLGEFILPESEVDKMGFSDLEISASKIRLDNGKEAWTSSSSWFADEEAVRKDIADYVEKGFQVKDAVPG